MAAWDITLEFEPEAVDWLAERGHQPEFGARPLRRVIQREVDNPMSRRLLDGSVRRGQRVRVSAGEDGLAFTPAEEQVEAGRA
jgi:ATP-dependent Clp protease ATP-binding subunit ClpC